MSSTFHSSTSAVPDAYSGTSKVEIVTGASSGIGLEVTNRLVAKGYRVVANSRNITSAMTLQATGDLKLVNGDIGLPETAQQVVAAAMRDFGRIDLLVNNAGVFIPKPFTEHLPEDFRRATETNLSGFFYVSQLAVAQMRLQKSGHVVNISSSLATQPIAGVAAGLLNLTKGGLESVTRALAVEFAGEGIRFNAIAPGVVNTPMNPKEAHEFLKQLSALNRLAEVGEVANLLLYLESAPFVNGEIIHLDGGRMLASGNEKRSWKSTRIVKLLGIDYPIIQAPLGGFPSQQLTAAVSNLGGLGSLGAVTLSSSAITEVIEEIRSLTTKPFAINLWVSTSDRQAARIESDIIQSKIRGLARYYAELGIEPPSQVESKPQDFEIQVRAAVDARPAVLSFIYGIPPAEILDECRKHAIRTIGTATTPEEAIALEEAGLDSIVASGFEGGGHRGSFLRPAAHSLMGGLSLIPQVVEAVSVPVIAAGGIADGRGVVAAHALGAEAVQIGTAFVSCVGSGASAAYRSALSSPAAKNTGLTEAFTGRLARGVRSRLMDELADVNDPALPFPLQHALIQTVAAPASSVREIPELMTVWAGQSASLCRCTDATEFMRRLIVESDVFFSA